MTPLRQRMLEDMQVRNLSPHTQASYCQQVSQFARYFGKSPEDLGPEDIRTYQVYLTNERNLAPVSILIAVAAIRFLYKITLKRNWVFEEVIPTCKKPQKLPEVLSPEEVLHLLDHVRTLKQRTILTTCYAAGLRVSEVTRLRVEDIDSARMVIHVRQGKGHKDRDVMLSPRLLAVLREYWKLQRPRPYLFPGRQPDRPVSPRTVQMVCQRALEASGLSKHVHMHTLRHNTDSRIMPTGIRRVTRDPANAACSSLSDAA